MIHRTGPLLTFFLVFSTILIGCAHPPAIRDSKVMQPGNAEKIKQLHFVYRQAVMKSISKTSWSRYPEITGGTSTDMGFDQFGSLLTVHAEKIFEVHGIEIAEATVTSDGEMVNTVRTKNGRPMLLLLVTPSTRETTTTTASTFASYIYSAQIIDPQTGASRWKASLDMTTWVGTDFLMRNVSKKVLNEDYARQFLNAIAEKLKADGLI